MIRLLLTVAMLFTARGSVTEPMPLDLIVVVGAPGEAAYESTFRTAGENWMKAAREGEKAALRIGEESGTNQLATLTSALAEQAKTSEEPLWLVFVGHGTFDGKVAKFNLHGPDISAAELAGVVAALERPLVFLNTTASSAPFLNALSGPGRVIVTATKSGWEENYARFGSFIAETIADPAADLDKDGQTSLLEAFLMASRRVEGFYNMEQRLATEHALIDDNGDGMGTPADFFQGVRATKQPEGDALPDGLRAHQLHLVPGSGEAHLAPAAIARRNELEIELEQLRRREGEMPEQEYFVELERILVEISRIYHPPSEPEQELPDGPAENGETGRSPVQ